jgi:hypothetical protein
MNTKNKQQESKFNIFHVAGIYKNEEIHTSIIAELINPQSRYHGYGQRFLNIFCEVIKLDGNFQGATIKTEVATTEGRKIDMVISTHQYYVPFEVKIWAKDQSNQRQHRQKHMVAV